MINKMRALGLHIVVAVLCLIMIVLLTIISNAIKVDILIKYNWLIAFMIIVIYFVACLFLKESESLFSNFKVGILITILGFVLWAVTIAYYNGDFFVIAPEDEEFWILFYGYLFPFKLILLSLNVKLTSMINLVMCILPCVLIGINLTIKSKLLKANILKFFN